MDGDSAMKVDGQTLSTVEAHQPTANLTNHREQQDVVLDQMQLDSNSDAELTIGTNRVDNESTPAIAIAQRKGKGKTRMTEGQSRLLSSVDVGGMPGQSDTNLTATHALHSHINETASAPYSEIGAQRIVVTPIQNLLGQPAKHDQGLTERLGFDPITDADKSDSDMIEILPQHLKNNTQPTRTSTAITGADHTAAGIVDFFSLSTEAQRLVRAVYLATLIPPVLQSPPPAMFHTISSGAYQDPALVQAADIPGARNGAEQVVAVSQGHPAMSAIPPGLHGLMLPPRTGLDSSGIPTAVPASGQDSQGVTSATVLSGSITAPMRSGDQRNPAQAWTKGFDSMDDAVAHIEQLNSRISFEIEGDDRVDGEADPDRYAEKLYDALNFSDLDAPSDLSERDHESWRARQKKDHEQVQKLLQDEASRKNVKAHMLLLVKTTITIHKEGIKQSKYGKKQLKPLTDVKFSERIDEMAVELKASKSICLDVMNGKNIEGFCTTPDETAKTKKHNIRSNSKRGKTKAELAQLKKVVGEHAAQGATAGP